MSNRLSLHISPCPNDTFVFHALIHNLIDTEGLAFDVQFEDIETLNQHAIAGVGDVVKASVAIAKMVDYTMLDSGAALGYGNGPIVVRRVGSDPQSTLKIAVPGMHTTAALLFRRYFPENTNIIAVPFRSIAPMVARGEADWGVLIHEGRFTFGELGLDKVADLGQLWEAEMGLPIPLGAIFASNRLDPDTIKKVERTIARSTIYALNNRTASAEFVRSHAGELSSKVLEQHIDYFVTDFTRSLSERGRQAIATLLAREAPTK